MMSGNSSEWFGTSSAETKLAGLSALVPLCTSAVVSRNYSSIDIRCSVECIGVA